MKKGLVPHQCWFEAIEEDKKVKKNLSRLIHTFQHIPSDRSGNSLRNLVNEIECFNPPVPKETRSFNRNLSHPLLDDKASSLLGRIKGERKLQTGDSNKQIAIVSTSSKSKNCKKSNLFLNKNKPKRDFIDSSTEICPDRKLYNLNKITSKNKLQKNSSNIQKRQDLRSKYETREEIKMVVNNHETNKNPNASKHKKLEVLDKVKSNVRRSTIGQKQLMFSRGLEKIVSKNTKTLTAQESNMVKKLTNYWNSVLNNDMDELQSEITSTRCSIKSFNSLEHLSQETQSTTSIRNIKSRSTSQIDLSTLKTMDKQNSNCMFNTLDEEGAKMYDQTETFDKRTGHHYNLTNTSPSTSVCTKLNSNVNQDCDPANTGLNETFQTRRSEIEFVIDTSQASVTLENLQRYIKLFPNASLLSDEICLPRSVKVMISLLTAALSSDQYKELWIEVSECEIIQNQHANNSESKQIVSSLSPQQAGGSGDFCMSQSNTTSAIIVVPNKNIVQVNNALKYISLCKEVLWTMYTSNPISCLNPPTGIFGFVYEETIMIEEIDCEYSESDEEEEEEVSMKDLIIAAANTLSEFTNSLLQCFSNNWPNSMQSIVRSIYYTIVSALVWWVIFKEIWYAK